MTPTFLLDVPPPPPSLTPTLFAAVMSLVSLTGIGLAMWLARDRTWIDRLAEGDEDWDENDGSDWEEEGR